MLQNFVYLQGSSTKEGLTLARYSWAAQHVWPSVSHLGIWEPLCCIYNTWPMSGSAWGDALVSTIDCHWCPAWLLMSNYIINTHVCTRKQLLNRCPLEGPLRMEGLNLNNNYCTFWLTQIQQTPILEKSLNWIVMALKSLTFITNFAVVFSPL